MHPLIEWLQEEVKIQRQIDKNMTMWHITGKAGVAKNLLYLWFHDHGNPTIGTLDAVLGVLGYRLNIEPMPGGGRRKIDRAEIYNNHPRFTQRGFSQHYTNKREKNGPET